jgi:hypothetical protein
MPGVMEKEGEGQDGLSPGDGKNKPGGSMFRHMAQLAWDMCLMLGIRVCT